MGPHARPGPALDQRLDAGQRGLPGSAESGGGRTGRTRGHRGGRRLQAGRPRGRSRRGRCTAGVRRRVGQLRGRAVRAGRGTAHVRIRHHGPPVGRGRRDDPQQRHDQPRGDDVRPRPVHRRRRARLPDGRHTLPPPGLLHRRRRWRRARGDHGRTGPRPAPPARRRTRRRHGVPPGRVRQSGAAPGGRATRPRRRRPRLRDGRHRPARRGDVFSLYDPNSFEIIRQLEILGLCGEGEGGPLAASGAIAVGGKHPVNPDGGCLAYAWNGTQQMTLKVVEAVRQLRGSAVHQVEGAQVAVVGNAGSGAQHYEMSVLGRTR
ncbi:thiolase C-terminal domain-containing protein [Streptomyces sp. GLT-R25]